MVKAVLLAGALASLVGCNTVRGVGEDLKSASNSVDRAL
jgi:predicted small secreted protein